MSQPRCLPKHLAWIINPRHWRRGSGYRGRNWRSLTFFTINTKQAKNNNSNCRSLDVVGQWLVGTTQWAATYKTEIICGQRNELAGLLKNLQCRRASSVPWVMLSKFSLVTWLSKNVFQDLIQLLMLHIRLPAFSVSIVFYFFKLIYLFKRDRESMSGGGAENDGERESQAGSNVGSTGPDTCGARTHETVRSWPELKQRVGCLPDWATRVPLPSTVLMDKRP